MNLAVIPARGGSQRIPRKNVRPFAGRPMIAWSIDAALASGLFDRVVVSTDDREVADVAQAAGAEVPFQRPPELATDHAGTLDVIVHAAHWADAAGITLDAICCLYATAPFVQTDDLAAARETLAEGAWDYVFAAGRFAQPVHRSFARGSDGAMELLFPDRRLTRTQDLPAVFHDAGQFYWGRIDAWRRARPIFGPRTTFIEIPAARVQDIDTPEDWSMAERLFEAQQRTRHE